MANILKSQLVVRTGKSLENCKANNNSTSLKDSGFIILPPNTNGMVWYGIAPLKFVIWYIPIVFGS